MREILVLLMFLCILPSRQVGAAPLYSLTAALGSLGGGYTAGTDLNNKGQTTGTSSLGGATQNAFFYDGTFLQDLGTLGGSGSIGLVGHLSRNQA